MGNKVHRIAVCDATSLAELTSAAKTVARTFDRSPLAEFYRAHGDPADEAVDSVDACLSLCVVDGYDRFTGLGELHDGTFINGSMLIPSPDYDFENPSAELLTRVLEKYGAYAASAARELLADESRRLAGPLHDWEPAVWATGDDLLAAARRVDEFEKSIQSDELRDALSQYSSTLRRAALASHAVVEWVEKN